MRPATTAVLLALLCGAPAASPPAPALAPKFLLKAKALKEEVRLGETITIELTLHSGQRGTVAVQALEIGSPQGLVFNLKAANGVIHQVAKLKGKFEGPTFKPDVLPRRELKGGAKVEATVELLAILPGKFEITPVFLGVDRSAQPEPLEAKPVTVTVLPGKDGETGVGAVVRTSLGNMTFALEPAKAYNTVHNYLQLAREGFYSKRVFHRIVKDFMVQTGCPKGNGTSGPGYYIPAEFNDIKHEKGAISMAREQHDNTAGSQFFVMTATNHGLDGRYAAFGRITDGMAVLDSLAAVPVQRNQGGEMSDPLRKPDLLGVDMVLLKPK